MFKSPSSLTCLMFTLLLIATYVYRKKNHKPTDITTNFKFNKKLHTRSLPRLVEQPTQLLLRDGKYGHGP